VSKGWNRYAEGRLYFIGGSVGLMLVLWSILFAQDQAARETQPSAVSIQQSGGAEPAPAQVQAPQTRTRGS
jgi:hypothetical protein